MFSVLPNVLDGRHTPYPERRGWRVSVSARRHVRECFRKQDLSAVWIVILLVLKVTPINSPAVEALLVTAISTTNCILKLSTDLSQHAGSRLLTTNLHYDKIIKCNVILNSGLLLKPMSEARLCPRRNSDRERPVSLTDDV